MNKNNIFLSLIKKVIIPFSFVLLSVVGCLSCSFTQDYKLDKLSFDIINYNKILGNSNYKSPILTITKTKDKIEKDGTPFYNDLFNVFHYNMLDNGARTIVDSSTKLSFNNSEIADCELVLTTQPTFSIVKKNLGTEDNPVYHVDSGQYYSYFPEIVDRHRGGITTSFVYISDTLANKIVDVLNVPGETIIEKYKNLVINESYCYRQIVINGSESVPIAINNVLHSDYKDGQAIRFNELYGDFALIWADRIKDKIELSFEIDLKTNPYGNKKIVKMIEEIGYTAPNSLFSIKTFDSDSYTINLDLSSRLELALKTSDNALNYIPFILVQLASLAFCYIFCRKNVLTFNKIQANISLLALFALYGVIVTFTYNYPLYSITPLLFLVFWFGFILLGFVNKKTQMRANFLNGADYYEIEI